VLLKMDITIKSIIGQGINFSDSSYLECPWELTPRYNSTNITLVLDSSRRTFTLDLDVNKRRFITCINVLMVDAWRFTGKTDKPKQIPYGST